MKVHPSFFFQQASTVEGVMRALSMMYHHIMRGDGAEWSSATVEDVKDADVGSFRVAQGGMAGAPMPCHVK